MRPWAKPRWRIRASIPVLTPEAGALGAQQALIDFADLFENVARAIEVAKLLADPGDLAGVDGDLTGLGAGIVDVEDPLEVAFTIDAGGARDGGGMESVAAEEGAAQDVMEGREGGSELTGGGPTSHLYR